MARISGQLQRKKAVCCGGTADPPAGPDRLTSVFHRHARPDCNLSLQRGRFLRALVLHGVASVLGCACRAPRTLARPPGRASSRRAIAAQEAGRRGAESDTREAMCLMIESAAKASSLPLEFFARVIWQESRFRSDAIGPVTRSGQRAQGLRSSCRVPRTSAACSIPSIRCRRCRNRRSFWPSCATSSAISGWRPPPTMPVRARVQEWLAGTGPMPQETRG